MSRRKLDTLEDHREAIEQALEQDGPYTHNILSLVLSSASKRFGTPVANDLVKEFALAVRYGIHVAPIEPSDGSR